MDAQVAIGAEARSAAIGICRASGGAKRACLPAGCRRTASSAHRRGWKLAWVPTGYRRAGPDPSL